MFFYRVLLPLCVKILTIDCLRGSVDDTMRARPRIYCANPCTAGSIAACFDKLPMARWGADIHSFQ
jgi:hypothetical protein